MSGNAAVEIGVPGITTRPDRRPPLHAPFPAASRLLLLLPPAMLALRNRTATLRATAGSAFHATDSLDIGRRGGHGPERADRGRDAQGHRRHGEADRRFDLARPRRGLRV